MKALFIPILAAFVLFLSTMLLPGCSSPEDKNPPPQSEAAEHLATDSLEIADYKASLVMGKYGCFGCHSTSGQPFQAPTFKNIFGRKTRLIGGHSLTIDEAYLRKSILEPSADVVEGYMEGIMPKVEIPAEDLDLIIDYLKRL